MLSDTKPANTLFRRDHVEQSEFGMSVRGLEAELRGGALTLTASERPVMDAAWENLQELEGEVRALELPYRRDPATWRP